MGRILFADDDPDIRDLVGMALERAGHEVTLVPDGQAAWELLTTESYDVTILDRMMPRLDGLALLTRCRADPGLHDAAIVLLTAKARDTEIQQGYDAGADRYVTKPFSLRELSRTVDELIPVA